MGVAHTTVTGKARTSSTLASESIRRNLKLRGGYRPSLAKE